MDDRQACKAPIVTVLCRESGAIWCDSDARRSGAERLSRANAPDSWCNVGAIRSIRPSWWMTKPRTGTMAHPGSGTWRLQVAANPDPLTGECRRSRARSTEQEPTRGRRCSDWWSRPATACTDVYKRQIFERVHLRSSRVLGGVSVRRRSFRVRLLPTVIVSQLPHGRRGQSPRRHLPKIESLRDTETS